MATDKRLLNFTLLHSTEVLNQLDDSERLLYIDLLGKADDDGIVDALMVLKVVEAKIVTFRSLCNKKFIVPLNENFVSYIPAWLEHSALRADRKRDSRYLPLLFKVLPDVNVQKATQRSDRKKKPLQEELPLLEVGRPNDATITTTNTITNTKEQQHINMVVPDDVDIRAEFRQRGLPVQCVSSFLKKYTKELIMKQLYNYDTNSKSIRQPLAWLNSACKDDYEFKEKKGQTIDAGNVAIAPLAAESVALIKKIEEDTEDKRIEDIKVHDPDLAEKVANLINTIKVVKNDEAQKHH